MKKIFFSALLLIGLGTAQAQTLVLPYTPGITTEGVTYYLPQTQLRFEITATCVTKVPGSLNTYAGRYLKLNDVPSQKEVLWTIDNITVTPYGVPDTTKVFSIPLKKGTLAPLVSLSKQGLLLAVNAQSEEETLPAESSVSKIEKSQLNPRDYMSQEILYAGSAAKMADLTAQEIYDIRENRTLLAKGQADNMPKDGAQLQLMINQLNTQEEALLQLFKGTVEKETRTFYVTYLPTKNVKKMILFRFSDQLGVVDANNLAGEPVYLDLTDQKTVPAMQSDGKKKKIEEQALRVNVPSDVLVKLYTRDKKYVELSTPMGQFGHTDILSSELFNKRTSTKVYFYQNTGAVKQIQDDSAGK